MIELIKFLKKVKEEKNEYDTIEIYSHSLDEKIEIDGGEELNKLLLILEAETLQKIADAEIH